MPDDSHPLLEGFSDPAPYTTKTVGAAPDEPGVHVVWEPAERGGAVLYVGQTKHLRTRLREHLSGDRQASVLHEQVGTLLDEGTPQSADRDSIRDWLGECQVAWKVDPAPKVRKSELIAAFKPAFNRRPGINLQQRVWWVNQGRTFEAERAAWMVFAGTEREDGRRIKHHQVLAEMRPGDVTLHWVSGEIRAIGEVQVPATRYRRPAGPHGAESDGLAARVEYFTLDHPIALAELPASRAGTEPFNKNGTVNQGYCFAVPSELADELQRQLGDRWPDGSPWSDAERRHWIFQANPKQWDLAAHLPDLPPGSVDTWTASKQTSRMQTGDAVLLWSGGATAGIYAFARLAGEPALEPTPDFRPGSVGAEEWRVPVLITAHMNPPLLKADVLRDPVLAEMRVLKQPWAGTNQTLTIEQWRAAIAAMPLEERMTSKWDAFVHWAGRLAESYDLEVSERQYKLEHADRLEQARSALRADTPWVDLLRQAMNHSDNNLVHYRVQMGFNRWLADGTESVEPALHAIWDESQPPGAAVEAFAEHLPTSVTKGAGTRASLASFLLLAVDPLVNPVIRPQTFATAFRLTDFPATSPETERTRYEDGVAFCDAFIAAAAERGLTIQDRLDAQGLIWAVVNYGPHESWSETEQKAFLAFRAGDASDSDRIAELVRAFREQTSYPVDGDENRERERAELAAALAPGALATPDVTALRRLAGPAYGSPGPQPGMNRLLQSDESAEQVASWLHDLLYGSDALEQRIEAALTGENALHGVKEAIVTKALAVVDPDRWFPSYVTESDNGKRRILDLLGLPPVPATLSTAEAMIDSNDRIRAVLEPHFPDDPWGMQQFSWWLLKEPDDPDAIDHLARDVTMPREFIEKVLRLIKHKPQLVFYGPPGTSKTYFANKLADFLARGGGSVERVQFHPSYSYEDFVEGYRPKTVDGHLSYQVVDGPLKRIALDAFARQDVTHVLLIDEFNRALVSKVLGELYFLLEYRDIELRLQYSDAPFRLPENLVIIATMNTADRSIALVDAALRRRFHFVGFYPDEPPVKDLLADYLAKHKLTDSLGWLPQVIKRANERLPERHIALGPSHFLSPKLTAEDVALIWEHSVMPYFEEQFLDDPAALEQFELEALRAAPNQNLVIEVDVEDGPGDGAAPEAH